MTPPRESVAAGPPIGGPPHGHAGTGSLTPAPAPPPPRLLSGTTHTIAAEQPLPSLVLPPGGLRLGEYLLHSELGRGGMGVVYKALHRALKREVAVKLMLSELEEDRARFRREAEASAGLKHPYIVPVHDVRVEDGKLFFAMDYIEGKTLRQLVVERSGEPRLLLEIFVKVCAAMGYAHRKGITHRDLKPQNIMIDLELNPHVMDFGLARRVGVKDIAGRDVSGSAGTMAMGTIVGTPAYMSPEQAGGRVDEIDARSDIYALGVTLYYILTTDHPFDAPSTAELLELIDSPAPPVPPRKRNSRCAWELERIVLKAIAKSRDDRYQTAFELMDDVRAWLAGAPVAAVHGGLLYRTRSLAGRNRAAVALGLVALAALIGSVRYVVLRGRADARERQARSTAFVADSAVELEVAGARLRDYEAAHQKLDPKVATYLLDQVSACYARAIERLSEASLLDPDNVAATLAAQEAQLGSRAVKLLEVKEIERQRQADVEADRRERAKALVAAAAARLAAIDPRAAKSLGEARAAREEVEAARAVFLTAVGVDPASQAAQDGVSTLFKKLSELGAIEETVARRERVAKLVAEADTALAQASTEQQPAAERRALRRAIMALAEALRIDPDDRTARERRVDAALRLGALAIEERNFSLAEYVIDEVRDIAGERGVRFLEEMRRARERTAPP